MVRWVGQRSGGTGGFTLIELLIVIVILAISAAIVVPMASSAASMQLRSAANMVAADLEYAKSLAIGTGQSHSVEFDAINEGYWIEDATGTTIDNPVKKDFPYSISFPNDGRLDRVEIVSTTFSSDTVSFNYLGSPTAGGSITLQAGVSQRDVTVEAVTGFIDINDNPN
ncbi:MAG TPA: GspH/FimT family pseudopilin [Sedimentisphaerales bacterium]|nr:GspH/FimT family pseudopilin [Sedimentisphaerales bacterium]HNU28086.1 GspH/FimT family pseudopilin [Sedimentisphaerales bacterium]